MSTHFVVAKPIGNLEDVRASAARVLVEVAVVFAEDTSRSSKQIDHLCVRTTHKS